MSHMLQTYNIVDLRGTSQLISFVVFECTLKGVIYEAGIVVES